MGEFPCRSFPSGLAGSTACGCASRCSCCPRTRPSRGWTAAAPQRPRPSARSRRHPPSRHHPRWLRARGRRSRWGNRPSSVPCAMRRGMAHAQALTRNSDFLGNSAPPPNSISHITFPCAAQMGCAGGAWQYGHAFVPHVLQPRPLGA